MFLHSSEEDGEQENKQIWYYSTKVQLAGLVEVLDKGYWESDLCAMLEELREEIHSHMAITEDLTNKARANNRSYLDAANGEWPAAFSGAFALSSSQIKMLSFQQPG